MTNTTNTTKAAKVRKTRTKIAATVCAVIAATAMITGIAVFSASAKTIKSNTESSAVTTSVQNTTTQAQNKAEETTKAKTAKEIEDDLFNKYRYNVDGETIVPEEEKGQAEAKSANGAKPEASAEDTTKAAETGNAEKTPEGKQGNKNNKTGNPYQNVDSQGDTFAFESPDGEFVENPSAPDGYSNSGITKSEDGEHAPANEGKKNTSKDTKEASEHIKQVYAEADERIPELISSDPEQAGKDLYTMITKGLDFLFFGKDFDGYTKDQVDEETIIYLRDEMFNYVAIAKSFEEFGVYTELETKYTEALEYLELSKEDPSIISNLDKIGEEILKEYTTEEVQVGAISGTAFTLKI